MSDHDVSRRKFITALGGAGAVAAIGAAAMLTPAVLAEDGDTTESLPAGVKSVQGSWIGTLSARGMTRGLSTFMSNGGLMTTNQRDTVINQTQGGGHGIWKQEGLHVETRLFKFVSDAQGILTAITEETTTLDMDDSGDTLTGKGSFTLYSLDGEVLQSESGDFIAKRITLAGSMEFL